MNPNLLSWYHENHPVDLHGEPITINGITKVWIRFLNEKDRIREMLVPTHELKLQLDHRKLNQ